jgi:ABC-type lipoprotein release transport system permease subunit
LITLQAVAINQVFQSILIDQAGGNVFIAVTGFLGGTLENVEERLDTVEGIASYTAVKQYGVRLVEVQDGTTGTVETREQLDEKLPANFNRGGFAFLDAALGAIDARDVSSNLPNMVFMDGRQLTAEDAGQNVMVIANSPFLRDLGIEVGDTLTFELTNSGSLFDPTPQRIALLVVGAVDPNQSFSLANSTTYAPQTVFPENVAPSVTNIIMDIADENIPQLRRALSDLPTVFVLEVRLLNDILNRLLSQFTTFPIVVALLGLLVGGVVIANSVALTTMERRKEIAVMKAVGLQRNRVLGMLLLENALMGFIGGLIGVGLGLVMLALLFGTLAALGGGSAVTPPIGPAILLMLLCMVIGIIAAISAAWNASGEKPLNVLRYE